jgi:hypothetical protein
MAPSASPSHIIANSRTENPCSTKSKPQNGPWRTGDACTSPRTGFQLKGWALRLASQTLRSNWDRLDEGNLIQARRPGCCHSRKDQRMAREGVCCKTLAQQIAFRKMRKQQKTTTSLLQQALCREIPVAGYPTDYGWPRLRSSTSPPSKR